MTSFERREEAFEAKFAHDEERALKARVRSLRMLALWAAKKRGETGNSAEDYARALIEADLRTPDAAFNQLVIDLAEHGVDSRQIREAGRTFRHRAERFELTSTVVDAA